MDTMLSSFSCQCLSSPSPTGVEHTEETDNRVQYDPLHVGQWSLSTSSKETPCPMGSSPTRRLYRNLQGNRSVGDYYEATLSRI